MVSLLAPFGSERRGETTASSFRGTGLFSMVRVLKVRANAELHASCSIIIITPSVAARTRESC
jgi:hypothetical protein